MQREDLREEARRGMETEHLNLLELILGSFPSSLVVASFRQRKFRRSSRGEWGGGNHHQRQGLATQLILLITTLKEECRCPVAHSRLRGDAGERVARRKTGVAGTETKESRHQGGCVPFSWSQVLVSSSQVSRQGRRTTGWVWEVWMGQSLLSSFRWWTDLED